ncbi:hypothetical protein PAQ31011_01477 [Pandoraea aquatica]|uniref:IPT/TIG domain-containing protein n=1 Tax=Pandoraea aquatica TaxID=2508290 RepID=A0A5E4TKG0_9BURK|nr:hypothetical protein [Pandoraea aquatica]VVD88041.1 hypothetical protein PAQ31011_01477 [Pandoraea aquatica]
MANISILRVTKPITRSSEGELEFVGTGFTGASKVHFIDPAGKKFTAKSFNVINDEMLTCVCPVFSESGLAKAYITVNGVDSAADKEGPLSASSASDESDLDARTLTYTLPKQFANEFEVLPLGFGPNDPRPKIGLPT